MPPKTTQQPNSWAISTKESRKAIKPARRKKAKTKSKGGKKSKGK